MAKIEQTLRNEIADKGYTIVNLVLDSDSFEPVAGIHVARALDKIKKDFSVVESHVRLTHLYSWQPARVESRILVMDNKFAPEGYQGKERFEERSRIWDLVKQASDNKRKEERA